MNRLIMDRKTSSKGLCATLTNLVVLVLALSCCSRVVGDVISADRVVPWVPGVTVGVRGGIPSVPAWTNATMPPYNVDRTGVTNAVPGLLAAWNDCPSNGAVILPDGTYNITGGLILQNGNGRVLRGTGSNTVLVGSVVVGNSALSSPPAINNLLPVHKGDTALTFSTPPSVNVVVGDIWKLSADFSRTNDLFPVCTISTAAHTLYQVLVVTAVSGTTISCWPPCVFDFTNNPILVVLQGSSSVGKKVGLEHLSLTTSNGAVVASATSSLLSFGCLLDSWLYDVALRDSPDNYLLSGGVDVCCQVDSCYIGGAQTAGTSHGGALMSDSAGCLFQNNIFAKLDQNGFMFAGGYCGNAFFGNFFTNVYGNGDIFDHYSHPVMNLWEHNVFSYKVLQDGYFGSQSHQTYLRNAGNAWGYQLKRWTSYMNVVGCVCPPGTGYGMCYTRFDLGGYGAPYPIFELGYPNIGNNTASDYSPATSMFWPGTNWNAYGLAGNGSTVLTNTQVNTTNLQGDFSWLKLVAGNPAATPLLFQDPANTNLYHPEDLDLRQLDVLRQIGDGSVFARADGTSSNLLVGLADGTGITVSNGWRVYVGGVGFWQHMTTNLISTHILHGDVIYTNTDGSSSLVWQPNIADHSIPVSLLYTNGAPSWWGTNRWPAIDPLGSPMVTPIPAELRYLGMPNGTRGSAQVPAPSGLRVISVSGG